MTSPALGSWLSTWHDVSIVEWIFSPFRKLSVTAKVCIASSAPLGLSCHAGLVVVHTPHGWVGLLNLEAYVMPSGTMKASSFRGEAFRSVSILGPLGPGSEAWCLQH